MQYINNAQFKKQLNQRTEEELYDKAVHASI